MQLQQCITFNNDTGVMYTVCHLCLLKHFHGIYTTSFLHLYLGMEWKKCIHLEDTAKSSLSNDLNDLEVLKSKRRMAVRLVGF